MTTSTKVNNSILLSEIDDLQIGKAGEYLVCADLILNNFIAYPSEQGLPYDLVMDDGNILYRIQVKTTRGVKIVPQRKKPIPAYIFHIGNNGKMNRRKKYDKNQVDLFALVALDIRQIAYIPFHDTRTTMNFRSPKHRGTYHDEQGVILKQDVIELKNKGLSCTEISETLNLTLSTVYRYSADVSIEQKGTNAGVYFDEFKLPQALCNIK